MSLRVQDYAGNTLAVGTRVMYGEFSPAVVSHISAPDIDDSDESNVKYGLYVTVKFDDCSTDRLWCRDITLRVGPHDAHPDIDETFEESGDLEVIA